TSFQDLAQGVAFRAPTGIQNPEERLRFPVGNLLRRIVELLHLVVAAAAAQAPIAERIEVSIVNVDVTVTANDGKPLLGLSRNDFEVFKDGRRQPITNFFAVENARSTMLSTGW